MADDWRYANDTEGPAEHRLAEHLAVMRANPPQADRSLEARIVRRARWQQFARGPLEVVEAIIAALAGAVRVFAGSGEPSKEERR
jgi:hypothetical protein